MPKVTDEMIATVRETKTKTERVFDGHFLHIDRDTVTTASGLVRSREYIRHPGASVIIALFDDETILMEFQWRQPCEKAFWELPAGKLDPNEKASVCARRELEEETGYQADQWYYLGKGLKAGDRHLDEGECLEVYRLPFKEVKEMTLNGDITDVKTIIGVFWLEKYLKGEMAAQAC